jgi:hypothetical protein
MEQIDHLSIEDHGSKLRILVVQFTGGGASIGIESSDDALTVIRKLRHLADLLEAGIKQRSKTG